MWPVPVRKKSLALNNMGDDLGIDEPSTDVEGMQMDEPVNPTK
jgi:hypothetical protein